MIEREGENMNKEDIKYKSYVQILKEELIPAMGCTEPIALAYGGAKAREVLGCLPEMVKVYASGSIIKNVKSVIVPHTNQLKGIPAAIAAGIIGGDASKELEVISFVSEEQIEQMNNYLSLNCIEVEYLESDSVFDIIIEAYKGNHCSYIRIKDYHTNIVLIKKDDQILFEKKSELVVKSRIDRSLLSMESIYDFINSVDILDIKDVLNRQIEYNMAISEEGIRGNYGANIGKVLLTMDNKSVYNRAKAKAAAGSDARMNGCELPVIINSGSGNQGITVSVPVIEVARELNVSHDLLLRALALSNLTAIHQKTGIGTLSAYCGAVSAAAGAGAGIAYLYGGDYEMIIHTVVNALAIVSGIVCDGAKASCAAKIASSVDAAILGYEMFKSGQEFKSGDGIVMNGVEATIRSVGHLGKQGMKETNKEIIKLMIEC